MSIVNVYFQKFETDLRVAGDFLRICNKRNRLSPNQTTKRQKCPDQGREQQIYGFLYKRRGYFLSNAPQTKETSGISPFGLIGSLLQFTESNSEHFYEKSIDRKPIQV